ncbi:MAG: hypothetical protein V3T23_04505 [Nitrososphaerales archaeon]
MTDQRAFPIQRSHKLSEDRTTINEIVYMRAYEVYCHVYSPQEALIDLEGRGCRGGFGLGELTAFLYARSFPQSEWSDRVNEAFKGMEL